MNSRWIFEYANIPVSGDDPLSGGYDLSTGRYTGTWASMASKRCDDGAAPAGWFTDPNSVPGGIDAVNAVRARPEPTGRPASCTFRSQGLTTECSSRSAFPTPS